MNTINFFSQFFVFSIQMYPKISVGPNGQLEACIVHERRLDKMLNI
jgi:hypothetical protein